MKKSRARELVLYALWKEGDQVPWDTEKLESWSPRTYR